MRIRSAKKWWRSNFARNSSLFNDERGDSETSLLAGFEAEHGFRFALHIGVKVPDDRLRPGQVLGYRRRARCWA